MHGGETSSYTARSFIVPVERGPLLFDSQTVASGRRELQDANPSVSGISSYALIKSSFSR